MKSTKIIILMGLALGALYTLRELRVRENVEPSGPQDESVVAEAIKPTATRAKPDKKSGARISKKKRILKKKQIKAQKKIAAHAENVLKKVQDSMVVVRARAEVARITHVMQQLDKIDLQKNPVQAQKNVRNIDVSLSKLKKQLPMGHKEIQARYHDIAGRLEVFKKKMSTIKKVPVQPLAGAKQKKVARRLANIKKSLKKLKLHKKLKKIDDERKNLEALFAPLKKSPPKNAQQKKHYVFLLSKFTQLKKQKVIELTKTKEAALKAQAIKSIQAIGTELARIRKLKGVKKHKALMALKPKVDALTTLSVAKTDSTVKQQVGALTTSFLAMQTRSAVGTEPQPAVPPLPAQCKKETCVVVRDQHAWRVNCDCGTVLGFDRCPTGLAYFAKGYQYDAEGQTKTSHLFCKPPTKDKLPGGNFPDADCDYSSCRLMMDENTYDFFNLVCMCKGKEYTFINYGACPTQIVYNDHWAQKLKQGLVCDGLEQKLGPYATTNACKNCFLGPIFLDYGQYTHVYCSECTDPNTKKTAQGSFEGFFIVSDQTVNKVKSDCLGKLIYCGGTTLECTGTCKPLPDGPYKDKCSSCAVLTDGDLYCTCNGKIHQLDGNVATCKNDYGSEIDLVTLQEGTTQLRCTPPSGKYLSTCTDCQLVVDEKRNFTQLKCTACTNKDQKNLTLDGALQCKKDNKDILDCTSNNCKLVCGSSCSGCSCKDDWPLSGPQVCQCSSNSYCDTKCAGQHLPGGAFVAPGATGVCRCETTGSGVSADATRQMFSKHCVYVGAVEGQVCPKPSEADVTDDAQQEKNQNWANKFCASDLVCSAPWASTEEFIEHRCIRKCMQNSDCTGGHVCRYDHRSKSENYGICGAAIISSDGDCYHSDECAGKKGCRDTDFRMCEDKNNPSHPGSLKFPDGPCYGTCKTLKEFGESCTVESQCRGNELMCIGGKCRYKCKHNKDCQKDGTVPATNGWTTCHWDMKDATKKYGHCASPRDSWSTDKYLDWAQSCSSKDLPPVCYDSMECGNSNGKRGFCSAGPGDLIGQTFSVEAEKGEKPSIYNQFLPIGGYGQCWLKGNVGDTCHSSDGSDCSTGTCMKQCEEFYDCAMMYVVTGICVKSSDCKADSDCSAQDRCLKIYRDAGCGDKDHKLAGSGCAPVGKEGHACSPGTCGGGLSCIYLDSKHKEMVECADKCTGVCIPTLAAGDLLNCEKRTS